MRSARLAKSGHGVLFTTHDPNHALRAADRAYLLRDGARIADGPVAAVLNRDAAGSALPREQSNGSLIAPAARWHSCRVEGPDQG